MSVSQVYKLDKVVVTDPALDFSAISNQRVSAGIEQLVERLAGRAHPQFRAVASQRPELQFTTADLNQLLTGVAIGGKKFTTGKFYFKQATETGSPDRATTAGKRIQAAEGVIHWSEIRLPHNGRAEADVMLIPVWDGVNDILVFTGSVGLEGNLVDRPYFGCGPVSVNGTTINGVQEVRISSGVQVERAGGESEKWDTFVGVKVTDPSVTVRTNEERNWSFLLVEGVKLDEVSGLICYGRKFAKNEGRVANGTAEHIKFQATHGIALPEDTSGDDQNFISDTMRFGLVAPDDATDPLVITPNSAIA